MLDQNQVQNHLTCTSCRPDVQSLLYAAIINTIYI